MSTVLFVDLWPETRDDGYWQERFTAIPPTASEAGLTAMVQHFRQLEAERLSANPPAGIILSGSRYNLLSDPSTDPENGVHLNEFAPLTALLARLPRVPVLGICFGHQYLNLAAGGTLGRVLSPERIPIERNDPAWAIDVVEPDALFDGLSQPRCVESHSWRVDRPAPDYRVVARSPDGVEAMRHTALPRVGVQFHPEYFRRPGATHHGRRLLLNWFNSL